MNGDGLQVEYAPIESVKPYEANAKIHDEDAIKRLAASIKEFGWTQPILIDEDGVILAGHRRRAAAELIEAEVVPVIRLTGLSPEQKRAYRIIDNKSTEESPWDFPNLDAELSALSEHDFSLDPFIIDDWLGAGVAPSDEEPPAPLTDDERKVTIAVGEFRFQITKAEYLDWAAAIRESAEFNKERVLEMIRERLRL